MMANSSIARICGFALVAAAIPFLSQACGQAPAVAPQGSASTVPCMSNAPVTPTASVSALPAASASAPAPATDAATPSEPNGMPCAANKDCVGACANFTCTAGTCKKAESKPNYGACSGSEEGPHRCFAGVCYTAYDCSSRCAEEVALRVAAGLNTEFAKCKGKDQTLCRKAKMHEDTPFFKETQRSVERCMLDCGYPSLDIPAQGSDK